MAYTPEQRRNIQLALRMTRGDSRRVRLALLEAGLVESSWRHLHYGDRDSQGVLQQRPSQGWGPYIRGPRGVQQDIQDFLVRARRADRGFRGSPGQLAQAVQRSAFPGRYDERAGEAQALLGSRMGSSPGMRLAGRLRGSQSVPGASQPAAGPNPVFAYLQQTSQELAAGRMPDSNSLIGALVEARQYAEQPSYEAQTVAERAQGGAAPIRPGGGWGGSKGVASGLVGGLGLAATSEKRERMSTASGGVSDHWVGSKNAYAYDLGGNTAQMDRAAVNLARRLGIPYRRGRPLEATINRNGYRIQVLYRTNTGGNHYDHIHVGVRRN